MWCVIGGKAYFIYQLLFSDWDAHLCGELTSLGFLSTQRKTPSNNERFCRWWTWSERALGRNSMEPPGLLSVAICLTWKTHREFTLTEYLAAIRVALSLEHGASAACTETAGLRVSGKRGGSLGPICTWLSQSEGDAQWGPCMLHEIWVPRNTLHKTFWHFLAKPR